MIIAIRISLNRSQQEIIVIDVFFARKDINRIRYRYRSVIGCELALIQE